MNLHSMIELPFLVGFGSVCLCQIVNLSAQKKFNLKYFQFKAYSKLCMVGLNKFLSTI